MIWETTPLPIREKLVNAGQEILGASTLIRLMEIVGRCAREITGADGATFVLKDGSDCYYADEDAIGPLWKGRRFPQTSCISGWVMMYRQPVVIEDVLSDPRIPTAAYRPTFVRSLAMVPVGEHTAIAAIGSYWATSHRATREQLSALQHLAGLTGEAMARVTALKQGDVSQIAV